MGSQARAKCPYDGQESPGLVCVQQNETRITLVWKNEENTDPRITSVDPEMTSGCL